MIELEEGAYYLVPEKREKRVVRLRSKGERHIVVTEAEGAGRWTLNREAFEQRLRDGQIVPVEPQWNPAGQTVEV